MFCGVDVYLLPILFCVRVVVVCFVGFVVVVCANPWPICVCRHHGHWIVAHVLSFIVVFCCDVSAARVLDYCCALF